MNQEEQGKYEEQGKKLSQLIAKCWADEGFKQKLLGDPAATLKAEGVESPAGLAIKAVENTDQVFHLVIPAKPTDLSDEDLDKVAAGHDCVEAGHPCGPGHMIAKRTSFISCFIRSSGDIERPKLTDPDPALKPPIGG